MSPRALQQDVKPRFPAPGAVARLRIHGLVRGLAHLLILGLAGCGGSAMSPSATAVAPPLAAPGLEGHVVPLETIEIGSLVSGLVTQVDCDEGQVVRAGQRCARIDARPFEAAVQREDAALRAALAREAEGQLSLLKSADVKEGVRAFLERRPAIFRGE